MKTPNTLNDVEYVRKDSVQDQVKTGPESIIRTYSAGVHIGTIKALTGKWLF